MLDMYRPIQAETAHTSSVSLQELWRSIESAVHKLHLRWSMYLSVQMIIIPRVGIRRTALVELPFCAVTEICLGEMAAADT